MEVQKHIERHQWHIVAPQLLTIEVLQVLRRRVHRELTCLTDAEEAIALLGDLGIHYYDHQLLATRVWTMRDSLTAYDACYAALAEATSADLLTCDRRMANAHGIQSRIILVE